VPATDYMIVNRPPTLEDLRPAQLEYRHATQPFIDFKIWVLSISTPTLIIKDGQIVEVRYSQWTQEQFAFADRCIAEIADRFIARYRPKA